MADRLQAKTGTHHPIHRRESEGLQTAAQPLRGTLYNSGPSTHSTERGQPCPPPRNATGAREVIPGSRCLQASFPGPWLTQHTLDLGIFVWCPDRGPVHLHGSLHFKMWPPPAGIPTSGLPRLHKLYIVSINPTAPFFLSRCKGVGSRFCGKVWPEHGVAVGPNVGNNEVITTL